MLTDLEKDLILKSLTDMHILIKSIDVKLDKDRESCLDRHQFNHSIIQKTKEDVATIKGRWFVLATLIPIIISGLFQIFIRKS